MNEPMPNSTNLVLGSNYEYLLSAESRVRVLRARLPAPVSKHKF